MENSEASFLRQLRATFALEATEHVQAITAGLLALEKAPPVGQGELVETVFREAHSLKGGARAVDNREVERLCQSLEDVFAGWRHGRGQPVPEAFDRLHRALDAIAVALAGGGVATAPAAAAAAPVPAAAGEPDGAAQTVRIAVDKLETQLLEAEEMLTAKLIAAQRVTDLRELCGGFADWRRAWRAVEPQLQGLRRSHAAQPAADPAAAQLAVLLDFLDWNARCIQDVESRTLALDRKVRQDRHAVGKLVDDLLEDSKKLLLLPFSSISGSFAKLVRDLCRDEGKEAELTIEGGDVEVDKRILEEIKDPLIHLLRNCVGHGVEPPKLRAERGKPVRAALRLAVARLPGNQVEITVSDDGGGIDAARVAQAAVERGLLAPAEAAVLAGEAALALVFQPALSTSAAVTQLSGRGLGLAIVREKAEKLGGGVSVASEPGRGTSFRIVLPATQVTFRGILVMAAGQVLVVPTLHVERVARVRPQDVRSVQGRDAIALDGRVVALVRLAQVLELEPQAAAAPQAGSERGMVVLVLGNSGQRAAFAVDSVIDEQEVLVKRLGKPLLRVRNVSGATVLGSGRLAPVLDVADLLKSVRKAGGSPRSPRPEQSKQQGAVLVAEDSITSRLLLKGILETAGYRVRTAPDGLEAFKLLQAEPFDLLVSDVEMPGLGGLELTARVRADSRLAQLPVVLVTGRESPEDRERGIDVGAHAYLVKSNFDQSDLLATVRRLI
ncbi:MAG TPA: response regulator [Ramlibacter sp.]|nr:response regulator [Ramlibacter sp.]